MADLSDVENAMVSIIGSAIYPNGIAQPSSLPNATPVRIDRGWPLAASLDADLVAGICNITVYPMPGTAEKCYQILDATYTIVPPSYGLTFSVSDTVVTVSGAPAATEYLTLDVDAAYIFSRTGATTAAILSALLADIQAYYPAATVVGTTLTIPGSHSIVARQGAQATLGKAIHRQRHAIKVMVWASSDPIRIAVSSAVDIALKQNIKLTMPDSSQALLIYSRTNVTDEYQKAMIYRRELVYMAEYATVQQFPGYVVTSTQTSITDPTNTAIANAIT